MRFISLFCLFALVSNLGGVFVSSFLDNTQVISFTMEEDDKETDQKSGKRTVNFLEEELDLSSNNFLLDAGSFFISSNKTDFISINKRIKEIKKAPLEIPPEKRV